MVRRDDRPTPHGGVRSEAYGRDALGRPTDDPAETVALEIVEFDADGDVIARTYGRTDLPPAEPPAGDTVYDHAGEWDLWVNLDGHYKRVETLDELRSLHDWLDDAAWRGLLAQFTVEPFWASAPQQLKDEAYAWLEATRPR